MFYCRNFQTLVYEIYILYLCVKSVNFIFECPILNIKIKNALPTINSYNKACIRSI